MGNFNVKNNVCPYHYRISTVLKQNLTPSGPNGASKSTFPDFHSNTLKFKNLDFAITLSDPDRFSVPDFIKIHPKTAIVIMGDFREVKSFQTSPNYKGHVYCL